MSEQPVTLEVAYPDLPTEADATQVARDFVRGMALAAEDLQDRNVVTELPATGIQGRLPMILVEQIGGDSDRFGGDYLLSLDVFAATYAQASRIARQIQRVLVGYPWRVSSGGRSVLVDRVTVSVPTAEIEWQKDSPIRRFQGTYEFSIRR